MVQVTGPAVVIICAIAYLGIDAIVHFVGNLFEKNKDKLKEDPNNK